MALGDCHPSGWPRVVSPCTEHPQMATVSMLENGEVLMSLRFRWPDAGNGEVIRATGFASITAYVEDNPDFAWFHSCRRDDGPADLGGLARDAAAKVCHKSISSGAGFACRADTCQGMRELLAD